jgi:hypothetical protein
LESGVPSKDEIEWVLKWLDDGIPERDPRTVWHGIPEGFGQELICISK